GGTTLLGQSTVSGTVTGFGSVIVDGVRIENAAVAANKEKIDGTLELAELKLGQHVEVEHDGSLVATKVRVNAEAEGAVSAVDTTAKTITVLGQLITINTDPTLGPVTVFDGYAALANVVVGDKVEIHALIKTDATGKVTMQATRIEKKTAPNPVDLVNGNIRDLSTSAKTFRLANLLVDYGSASILPANAVLANGAEVQLALPAGTVAGTTAVKASVIKVRDHKAEVGAKDVELGGVISTVDTATKTLTINGAKIDVSAAVFDQAGKTFADLKVDAYVVIKGTYTADGVLKAARVVLRGTDQKDTAAELHGTVTNFVSAANFTVRGVKVDATGVVLDAASCGTSKLGSELQVGVIGTMNASGLVKATTIKCEKTDGALIVLSRLGTVSNVDASAKSFSLTTSKETLTMKWTSSTVFRDVEAATLAGKAVEVEGTTSAGVWTITKIVLQKPAG
ncbi:MAG: DUF5666 domain-containing protein, partial [Massilia sp.]